MIAFGLAALAVLAGAFVGAGGLLLGQQLLGHGDEQGAVRRRRDDERRLRHLTHVAMVQMLAEARRQQRP